MYSGRQLYSDTFVRRFLKRAKVKDASDIIQTNFLQAFSVPKTLPLMLFDTSIEILFTEGLLALRSNFARDNIIRFQPFE